MPVKNEITNGVGQTIKYDFNDLLIQPSESSNIESRSEIKISYDDSLPLFVAPMDTVIDESNYELFLGSDINVCLPRGIETKSDVLSPHTFTSYSLNDIIDIIKEKGELPKYVLIDIANGHMSKLFKVVKTLKERYDIKLMVGNIANPKTYSLLSIAGADYIRVGIGNGAGCWLEGAKIKTKKGYKNIEDINTDDEVLTHTGEYKKVILTHELNYNDDLVDINGNISTKDHKYYVIKKSDKDKINELNYTDYAIWLEAKDLTDDYLLLEMEKMTNIN